MKCVKCQYEMPIGYTKCPVCKHVQKNKINNSNVINNNKTILPKNENEYDMVFVPFLPGPDFVPIPRNNESTSIGAILMFTLGFLIVTTLGIILI